LAETVDRYAGNQAPAQIAGAFSWVNLASKGTLRYNSPVKFFFTEASA